MTSRINLFLGNVHRCKHQVLQISPVAITNFLVSDGNGGYLPSDHDYTIKAMAGTQPLANQSIAISTTLGTLNWQGMSGNSITAMSDTNGEVFCNNIS